MARGEWISYSPDSGGSRRPQHAQKSVAPWLASQPSSEIRVIPSGQRTPVAVTELKGGQLSTVLLALTDAFPDGRTGVMRELNKERPGRWYTDEVKAVYTLLKDAGMRIEDIAEACGWDSSKSVRQKNGTVRTSIVEFRALLGLVPEDNYSQLQRAELIE